MHRNKRRVILGSLILTFMIALCYLKRAMATKGHMGRSEENHQAGDAASSKSVQASLFEITKGRLPDAIDGLIGTVKGNTIELSFNGQEERLAAIHAHVGEQVKQGDVLFELDHLRSAARKSQAEANLARARELEEVGGATQHDVEEAQAARDLAKKDYDDTFVVAPKNGVVCQINRQVGESVSRSEVVAVLVSSDDNFYLETGVIEGQIEQVREGQKAVVQIEAFGHEPIQGVVRGVSREVTTTGRTGTVQVSLPERVQSKLRPGMSGECKIYVFNEETLTVPRTAYDDEKKGIYVVDKDRKAHLVPIVLGHLTRDYYEAKEGVHVGDKVVNDIVSTPIATNSEVVQVGELVHYKNLEEPSEKK